MITSLAYDLSIALATGLVTGLAAGYYSGLLIAKLSKFNSLKYEALRAVRGINYIGDEEKTQILKAGKVDELHLIGSELLHLKHRRAGETVLRISNEAANAMASCGLGSYSVESLMTNIGEWQTQLRKMHVGPRILVPWGQI